MGKGEVYNTVTNGGAVAAGIKIRFSNWQIKFASDVCGATHAVIISLLNQ